jgi:hypothetical protein
VLEELQHLLLSAAAAARISAGMVLACNTVCSGASERSTTNCTPLNHAQ